MITVILGLLIFAWVMKYVAGFIAVVVEMVQEDLQERKHRKEMAKLDHELGLDKPDDEVKEVSQQEYDEPAQGYPVEQYDVLDDAPIITQDEPEEPIQQAEMAEDGSEQDDEDDLIPLTSDEPNYQEHWLSHERTGMVFEPDYTVVDIETMGFDYTRDKIVEISAVRVRNHEVVDHFQGFNNKSRLGKFLKENSPITIDDIEGGVAPEQLLQDFMNFLGDDPMIGHNIGFDLNFLRYNLHYYGFGDLINEFVDTMLIGKHYANPDWQHHRVDDYIAYYPDEVGFDNLSQHSAYNDVLIEQRIYEVERGILGDDFGEKVTPNMFWALPKIRVVETAEEVATRVTAKKMIDAIRIAIDDRDYTYSNQLIDELFAEGVTNHSKLYKRMVMNYKKLKDNTAVLHTIIRWQSNMGGDISKTDAKWIQEQMNKLQLTV